LKRSEIVSKTSSDSYVQILKSSSLIGGAHGVSLIIDMVRIKFVAVLIGPIGLGLVGTYRAIQTVFGMIAGLGIQSSAVRDVSLAVEQGDDEHIGRTILTLRRVVWVTGLFGAVLMALSAEAISHYTFGSDEYAFEISLLGLVVLMSNIEGGQSALIQGMRRIGDLARLNVIGAFVGTIAALIIYAWLGLQGIIPALLLIALIRLIVSWYFARKIPVRKVAMSWMESFYAAGGMARLGLSFMWSGLLVAAVAYITRLLIIQQFNMEAVGIFAAAFALSGMFVNFILSAMGADYVPRLSAVSNDHSAMNRLVNEQTEIGLLLAVPGLLATLTLAPWIIRIFYTSEFLPAAELLQWFILGCLGRVISWPMGFITIALGKGSLYAVIQTIFNILHVVLIGAGLMLFGVEGVAVAFFLLHVISSIVNSLIFYSLTGFRWSASTQHLLVLLLPVVVSAFLIGRLFPIWPATGLGVTISAIASILCVRELVKRIGHDHRVSGMIFRIPGMRRVCGI
jgi:PST family polysaccharide transporter